MNPDGSDKKRLTHFNVKGYPEYDPRGVVVADFGWLRDSRSILAKVRIQSDDIMSGETVRIIKLAGLGETLLDAEVADPLPVEAAGGPVDYVVEEIITITEDGGRVSLTPDNEPGLLLNNYYIDLLRKSGGKAAEYRGGRLQRRAG